MQRRRNLERKLFGWLAVVAVVPALIVLLAALFLGNRSLEWVGTLGPWNQVAESGRTLIEAAERAAVVDPALGEAAGRHREDLSASLMQASRWRFLGDRLAAAAPLLVGGVAIVLIALALLLSRVLARELARPIAELVAWAGRLGRGEPLPEPDGEESGELEEVQGLRTALRNAATEIRDGRRRALEAERTRAWGEMARRVAHEMKNPLTPLRLAAHRIDGAAGTDASLREAAAVIREETERLDELARSFATLGRPAPGPPTEVDLHDLLGRMLETDVPGPIRRSLDAVAGTSSVLGHYDALQRAFRNVIRNAVEALADAGDGSRGIDVTIRPIGDGIEVVVADDGPGIPDELTEAIFEADRTLKTRGTGLGLAVVRQVAAAHGGTVVARNRRGGGAEFSITLPRKPHGTETPTTGG